MKTRTIIASCLLLTFVGGWVVKRRLDQSSLPSPSAQSISMEVTIKSVEVRQTGDHAQLILTAVFDQNGQTPVQLEPPLVLLLGTDGKPAARYLGPMLPEPLLTGEGPAEVTLHYWLSQAELNTPLQLEAAGRRYPLELPRH